MTDEPAPDPEVEVDARGLRCPMPVIALARAAQGRPPGSRLVLLATDPAAGHDVAAWCRMRGHALADTSQQPEHTAYRVVLG